MGRHILMPLILLLEVGCFEDTDLSPSSAATSGDTGSSTSSSGGTASTTIDASTDTSAGATSDEPSATAGTSLTDPGSSGTSDGSSSTGANTQTSAETLDTTTSTSTSESSTSMVPDLPAPILLPVYALCFYDSECESGWCLAPDNKTRGVCSVECVQRGANSPDCPAPPPTGVETFCLDDLANGALGCVLNCSGGLVCPDDLVCADETFNGNVILGVCL